MMLIIHDDIDYMNSNILKCFFNYSMAEFMNPEDEEMVQQRGAKGRYSNPFNELRVLSEENRDRELIKRYRFHKNGIQYIASLIEDQLAPKHGQKGNPIPVEIQVSKYWIIKLIMIIMVNLGYDYSTVPG